MDMTKVFTAAEHCMAEANAPGGVIPFAFPGVPNVGCAFGTALAGNIGLGYGFETAEAAVHNRRHLLASLGLTRWVELRQVHKDQIRINPAPTPPEENSDLEGDGATTDETGLALAIKTADCQPILLTDKKGTAVAALHAGWRGNAIDFPGTGVLLFCETYGLKPQDILAVRGPSLGPAAAEFVNFASEWPAKFSPWYDAAQKTMNLWGLARAQLEAAGLRPEHIYSVDLCTWSLPGYLFSHRRGHAGRQASLIWKRR